MTAPRDTYLTLCNVQTAEGIKPPGRPLPLTRDEAQALEKLGAVEFVREGWDDEDVAPPPAVSTVVDQPAAAPATAQGEEPPPAARPAKAGRMAS